MPGKSILMGEHAAVYGRPALVAAVGLRLTADLIPDGDSGVELDLVPLGHREHVSWDDVDLTARKARLRWEAYAADPSIETFAALQSSDAARLVKIALGECRLAAPVDDHRLNAARLRVDSELPVGAGLGSSAAAAVAVVVAWLATLEEDVSWARVGPIVAEIERRQHGFPSGVDGTTVFHGGVISAWRDGDALAHEPLAARSDLLRCLRLFDSGRPGESTGEVVAAVAQLRATDPARFERTLERMSDATRLLRRVLGDPESTADDLLAPVRAYQRQLEAIGVVPEPVCSFVEAIEKAGGAAKISGAGSLAGPGAGSLLVVMPEDALGPLPDGARRVLARLGAEGMRLESVA